MILGSSVSGCAQRPPAPVATVDVWCQTNEAERPTVEQYALYNRDDKERMAAHNMFGADRCGWKP